MAKDDCGGKGKRQSLLFFVILNGVKDIEQRPQTPKVRKWAAKRRRLTLHFTPNKPLAA
jgi:hypothetical protein